MSHFETAYNILAKIPEERYVPGLKTYFGAGIHDPRDHPHDCGTLACAAGWLALSDEFHSDRPSSAAVFSKLYQRFGAIHFLSLFASRNHGFATHDCEVPQLTDKQVVLYRLRRAMHESPEVALSTVLATEQRIA